MSAIITPPVQLLAGLAAGKLLVIHLGNFFEARTEQVRHRVDIPQHVT